MPAIKVSADLVQDLVFGFAKRPVTISGGLYDSRDHTFTFDIKGEDVPDAERVTAICTIETNAAGQRFNRMTFEKVE